MMKNSNMNALAVDSGLTKHKFPWKWYLKDLPKVQKNGLKVFSTFSCGGGSSMGYKLAGFEVVGNCEIDPQMEAVYKENHNPEFSYLMDIRDFNKLGEYPEKLQNLDILDGSPPCSVFSSAGAREKGWGKEKVFREGQKSQRLDDLFFEYIHTAEILKPKVVIAENVKGLLLGNAKGYINEILKAFDKAGYCIQIFLLNAATMGVPQKRERVFFVGHQKEFDFPKLQLFVNEPPILFGEVRDKQGKEIKEPIRGEFAKRIKKGDKNLSDISKRERGKESGFTTHIIYDEKVANTLVASCRLIRFCDKAYFSNDDCRNVQTFPQDYNFLNLDPQYICGMSVPPVMMAHIASAVAEQWLSKADKKGT